MYTLVITGGIGSGKSLAVSHLESCGAKPISLDAITHELLENCAPMREAIAAEFGKDIFQPDGAIDTKLLASRAFSSPQNTSKLDGITFPFITKEAERITRMHALSANAPKLLVIEVPLLAEAPQAASMADEVMAISAPVETRVRRAVERGMDEADVRRRISLQATDAQREAIADTIVENDSSVADFIEKLDYWMQEREKTGWKPVRNG